MIKHKATQPLNIGTKQIQRIHAHTEISVHQKDAAEIKFIIESEVNKYIVKRNHATSITSQMAFTQIIDALRCL